MYDSLSPKGNISCKALWLTRLVSIWETGGEGKCGCCWKHKASLTCLPFHWTRVMQGLEIN